MKIKLTTEKEYTVEELESLIAEAKNTSDVLYMIEKPKQTDQYYHIDSFNIIESASWRNDFYDQQAFATNNIFATKENAERAKAIKDVERELKTIARELNNGKIINWQNQQQKNCLCIMIMTFVSGVKQKMCKYKNKIFIVSQKTS